MYSQENTSDSVLFSTVAGLRTYTFKKKVFFVFCKICEVLQNLISTEDSLAAASDFQQHFRHINSQLALNQPTDS